ncbi:hypothetical protein VTI74DRAFT_9518 [Chaetomium olivicolor]
MSRTTLKTRLLYDEISPYYWRHLCCAGTDHAEVQDTAMSVAQRWRSLQSMIGLKCKVEGCKYTVAEETVILNERGWKLCTVGGRMLYGPRLHPKLMKCCACGNKDTEGHEYRDDAIGGGSCMCLLEVPGPAHNCRHHRRWVEYLKQEQRSPGPPARWKLFGFSFSRCRCVIYNGFGEPLSLWSPRNEEGKVVKGSPLDLHLKYCQRTGIVEDE